jgi:hypothetical protein
VRALFFSWLNKLKAIFLRFLVAILFGKLFRKLPNATTKKKIIEITK